jgi:hypothetical protein
MLRDQVGIARRVLAGPGGTPPTIRETASALVVSQGANEYAFDRATGTLSDVKVHGAPVSFGNGPRAAPGESTLTGLTHRVEGQDLVVEATYDGVLRSARWRVRANGWLSLDYRLRVPGGAHPSFGITFDYPAEHVTGLRWLGRGPYRVWKNRLDGPTFGVWSNTANDAVTGESWQYPEFRGFFADLYWATVGSTQHPITVVAETPGMFLRMLTPRQPRDPRMTALPFPEGDISFLHGIPPIGTKFHAANVYGPESQPNLVNGRTGTYEGTLHFAFGRVPVKAQR